MQAKEEGGECACSLFVGARVKAGRCVRIGKGGGQGTRVSAFTPAAAPHERLCASYL